MTIAVLVQDVSTLTQQALKALEAGSIEEATRLLQHLTQRTRAEALDEIEMLTTLSQLLDEWPRDVTATELQRSYARVLRSILHRLFDHYTNAGARNKARLVVTLHSAMFYAEDLGLSHRQISALQNVLAYLQRPSLTIDELRECERQLRQVGVETTPTVPNFEHFLAQT